MRGFTRRKLGAIAVGSIAITVAGCTTDSGPPADEDLSKSDAAEYVSDYVEENYADRDDEAFNHFQNGVEATDSDEYSTAIYELENAIESYETLETDAFDKRNEYDEEQNRYELFDLAWNMYRLTHGSAAAHYNGAYAIQVKGNRAEAREHFDKADALYQEASEQATDYFDTIEIWNENQ